MKSTSITMLTTLAALTLAQGCVLKPEDDADRFRDAIPQAEAVKVDGPETVAQAPQSQSASFEGLNGVKSADEPWADGPWAYWYGFTRHIRQGVNKVTAEVLGGIWIVVNTKPTSVEKNEAIWGPYTDSLEPVTYRFRVTEVNPDEYDYALEGRPKGSTSDADYKAVLYGKGWGKGNEKHGDGFFVIDLDASRELDPFGKDPNDSGTVRIDHDLPSTITTDLFSGPRLVTATVTPSQSDSYWSASSTTNEDGTGMLFVDAHDDVDDSNATLKEDVQIRSRWNEHGAGRADITLQGGDVPQSLGTVAAVECWDSSFARVYYDDSVDYAPSEGDVAACAYSEPLSE